MLRYIALVVLAYCCATAAARAQNVDNVEIVDYGIFETKKKKEIPDASISTGQRVDYDELEITKRTSVIKLDFPEQAQVVFGARFKLSGSPSGQRASVGVVWLYPEPGLMYTPGVTKFRDEFDTEIILGGTKDLFWTIGAPATRVPGKWTLQVWQGERLLVEKTFDLVK